MKRTGFLLHILFLLGFYTSGYGQLSWQQPPEAKLYNIENGLSQTRVNVNYVDKSGFLWIGTSDGLNRFDGYNFEIFRYKPFDSLSLSNNHITCISEDSKGRLWIGTNMGLNCYVRETGKFRSDFLSDNEKVKLNSKISAVLSDKEGFLWIVANGILIQVHSDSLVKNEFQMIPVKSTVELFQEANCMIKDRKGTIWIGTKKGLLSFSDRNTQELFSQYDSHPYSLSNISVNAIFEDRNGEIWIGTNDGIKKYDRLNHRFTRVIDISESILKDYGKVISIAEDNDGNLWFSAEEGLFLFSKRQGRILPYYEITLGNSVMQIRGLNSIICDNSNILWMGSERGLLKIDLKPKKFELYTSLVSSYPQLSHNNITAVCKDENNFIWIGYWDNGIDRIKLNKGLVSRYSISNTLSSEDIRCFYPDSDNRLWVGTSEGIDIVEKSGKKITSFEQYFSPVPSKILSNKQILVIKKDSAGIFWIGTNDGLYAYNEDVRTIRSFRKIYNQKREIHLGEIFAISIDPDNNLWLGTANGLIMYRPSFDLFERLNPEANYSWLNNSPVYSILSGSDNNIWIGTSYGLSAYNRLNNQFIHYSEEDGLANCYVYTIQEDIESNIWVSTNKGLSMFDRVKKEFRNFSENDGLQVSEFKRGASFATTDGELFFGGISGLNSFYPDEILFNPVVPPVKITRFEVIDASGINEIHLGDNTSFVKVSYNQSFRISFSALDFSHPESNQYIYSLEELGKPEKRLKLGKQNSVTISNLPSGEYVFNVIGSNNDGKWNTKGDSLRILVEAPFWKTRIALIILVFIVIITFYFLIQFRTRSLRQTNRILKERECAGMEISKQKELLSKRNKNIEDSLKYAQRIQKAMLTTPEEFRKHLPDSFILHKPKDIVSGDFYWLSEVGDSIFIAAADCTGHGVPGAFMSIIGFELFRKIINMQGIRDPGKILNNLNQNFQEIFASGNDISLRDGMDLAFCVFNKKKKELHFAGAFSSLYIIRDNKLIELKGDRFSVGADDRLNGTIEKSFKSHRVKLEKDDMIYLFSDGFADQFGGAEGKKYKYRRFRHLLLNLHQLPPKVQKSFLNESIEEWRGNYEQIDDILVIGIKPGL